VQYLDAQAGPGDAVLYAPSKLRAIATELTGAARELSDLALDVDPLTAATLAGVEVSPADLDRRLATTHRVWLVHSDAIGPSVITPTDAVKMDLLRRGFVRVAGRAFVSVTVDRYQR